VDLRRFGSRAAGFRGFDHGVTGAPPGLTGHSRGGWGSRESAERVCRQGVNVKFHLGREVAVWSKRRGESLILSEKVDSRAEPPYRSPVGAEGGYFDRWELAGCLRSHDLSRIGVGVRPWYGSERRKSGVREHKCRYQTGSGRPRPRERRTKGRGRADRPGGTGDTAPPLLSSPLPYPGNPGRKVETRF
jgi:hypothetical protein